MTDSIIKKLKNRQNYDKLCDTPFEQLLSIASLEDDGFFKGPAARNRALRFWWKTWVETVENEMPIINYKKITSENLDLIKEHMAIQNIEKFVEDCMLYYIEEQNISCKVNVIRKKPLEY